MEDEIVISTRVRCFIEVAKCMNFTEASEKLYMTQPAISRNISMLEEEWGVKLFERNNKRKETTLTAAGQILAEGLIELEGQFSELLMEARQVDRGEAGVLKIGLIDGECIDDRILNALKEFQESSPKVNISLRRGSYGEITDWLEQGKVNCCIYPEFVIKNREGIEWSPLFELNSLLILSQKHPLAKTNAKRLIDCSEWTFLVPEHRELPAHVEFIMSECGKAGFVPKISLVPNVKEQHLLMETGKGIMIGSQNNMYVEQKHMMTILLEDLKPIPQVLAWKKDSHNPCVKKFYDLIK